MNASDIAAALATQAETICRHYLPNGRKQGNYWTAGDIDGAPGRSFVVRLAGPGRAGKWNDYSTGDHGDLLDIVQHRTGAATVTDAIAHARAFLALPETPRTTRSGAAPDSYDGTAVARRIWQHCRPIADTHAEAYLNARAIRRCRFPALRFHSALTYRHQDRTERFPALVAAVTEPDGRIRGVHRTYLDPARPSKANVPHPRKTLGSMHGHAVRFRNITPGNQTLVVAEGIETLLSIATAMPTAASAAALSAGNIAAFTPPRNARRIVIARDNDRPGAAAADHLLQRCVERSVDAVILSPTGGDWNDDLMELGTDVLAERVSRLFEALSA